MKTEVLLRSIGKINDELIADAESEANTKRKPGWAKLGTMAACLALVLCTGIATHAIRSNATAGTFTMDVNPSVEYTIAKSGAVKSIRSLNSDAEAAHCSATWRVAEFWISSQTTDQDNFVHALGPLSFDEKIIRRHG